MKKRNYVLSLVFNVIMVCAGAFALLNTFFGWVGGQTGSGVKMFNFFTNDSNILLVIAGVIMIIADCVAIKSGKGLAGWAKKVKLIATVAVTVTLLTVWCVFLPMQTFGSDWMAMTLAWPSFLWLHTVCPLLAIVSFVGFEHDSKMHWANSFLGLIPTVVYAAVMICMVMFAGVDAPYPMLDVKNNTVLQDCLWCGGMVVGTYLISLLLVIFHNLGYKCASKGAAKKDEVVLTPEKAEEVETSQAVMNEPEPVAAKKEEKPVVPAEPEEKKEEQPAPEEKVEEKPAEEAKPEEKPAEEAKPEEKPAEEPVKEEKKPAPKKKPAKKEEPKEEAKPAPAPAAEPAKEEPKKEDDVAVIEDSGDEAAEEQAEVDAENKARLENPTTYQNGPRVYHIAKQDTTGKWQVKLATGQKAIKLFDTQAEAIDYAKGLVKTQGGSIRVHSLKGKMRKE
jgi:hypothetical protein